MLTREAVAAAFALAGIRSGAHVLDLAPASGLGRAARAAAGPAGRVDGVGDAFGARPPVRYGYAIGVWPARDPEDVVVAARSSLASLAPYARVTLGSSGSLAALVDGLRADGWTVLHGTTVASASASASTSDRTGTGDLALAVARVPV